MELVSVFNENLNRLKEHVKRLQHNDAVRKMQKVKLCVQNHPVEFTLLGIITFVTFVPCLIITVIVMAPLVFILSSLLMLFAGILIVCFSFFFGFFLIVLMCVSAAAVACYILHCIAKKSILDTQKLASCISSFYTISENLKSAVCGILSHLQEFDGDLAKQKEKEADVEEEGDDESDESDYTSALEEMEPDDTD